MLLGLLAALPLLLRGSSCGHDFDFHLQSWFAVHEAWKHGLWAPHWVAAANYGAGEPRLVFYPPLSWLLGASLAFALPWAYVPAAFTGICFAGAAWSMRRLAQPLCAPVPAWAAAVFYAFSPYLLFTGYERTAYGELLAAVWMPLLFGSLLASRLSVPRVALPIAALWYTNAPAAVMGCYLVLLNCAWRIASTLFALQRKAVPLLASHVYRGVLEEVLRTGGALLLGGALAADYLLPAFYEQRFVAIDRAVGPGMRVEDSFLFGHTGEPYHDQVLHDASWIAVATLAAGLLAAAWVAWGTRRRQSISLPDASDPAHTLLFPMLVLPACLLLQLPFTGLLWRALPELRFLQFPWRLLLPASAAAALLLAVAVALLGRKARFTAVVLTTLLSGGALLWAAQTRYQPCDDEDNVGAQQALLRSGAGFEGTDEYAAIDSDNGEIQRGLPSVRLLHSPDADEGNDSNGGSANPQWMQTPSNTGDAGRVQVRLWTTEAVAVRALPEGDSYAVLRLERFPAWQVLLNGAPCGSACVLREDGLLTVHLPPGRESEITARYRATGDVWAGRALSTAALLGLLGWPKKRREGTPIHAQL